MTFRRKAKVDSNQSEIVNKFRELGWSVAHTHQLKNFCDIVVAKNKNTTILIEIKDGNKAPSQRKLTKGEQEFMDSWKGDYRIVLSIEDVNRINEEFNNGL